MVALFYILPLHHCVVQKYDKNEVKKRHYNTKEPTICQILYSFIRLFGLFVFIVVTFTSEALFLYIHISFRVPFLWLSVLFVHSPALSFCRNPSYILQKFAPCQLSQNTFYKLFKTTKKMKMVYKVLHRKVRLAGGRGRACCPASPPLPRLPAHLQ